MESPEKDRQNKIHNIEDPAANAAGSSFGFGKKRGRKEEKVQRLTASAVFHEYRIISDYDRGIKDLRTILGEFMNYLEAFFLR